MRADRASVKTRAYPNLWPRAYRCRTTGCAAASQTRHGLQQIWGSWVHFVSGDYGAGKTFLYSWLREAAWKEGFVVAAVDLGRDAPFHRFDVLYQRIDVLDDIQRDPHVAAAEAIKVADYADRIEAVERHEAHLTECS